ncbi:MAG: iron-containing redox enzyme family protein [Nitrospiraceae bacterium]
MTSQQLPPHEFRERLLSIMDRKHHWAWPHFTGNSLTKDQLKIHFQQEYAVYVRDFPVLLARILGKNPPMEVRTILAQNIYEEETGGLSVGRSHPELFLTMMMGLGYDRTQFQQVALLPSSCSYRSWLDAISTKRDWLLGAAVLTILVEGSVNDRQEILSPSKPKTTEEIEDVVSQHPLVQHHRLSPDSMDLVRAHQMVEAAHRHAAYKIVVSHALKPGQQRAVMDCLTEALRRWLSYRDGIVRACGIR